MNGGMLRATIVITTKNRRDELRRALQSCVIQSCAPEILVLDDGSTDGTSEMVTREFPTARLVRSENSEGYIAARNRGAKSAIGDIIVSIDDDAEFSSRRVIEQTLREFGCDAVGAVAIPFIDVLQDRGIRQRSPADDQIYVTAAYIGTAHAIRRELFLRLGGYRAQLFHQGEESDFCIRMLDAGYFVRLGAADPIHHHESARRDTRRMALYGGRNRVLFAWHNVRVTGLALALARVTVSRIKWGLRSRRILWAFEGWWLGLASIPREWRERKPVSARSYRLFRLLERRGAIPLNQIGAQATAWAYART
jgi:glycosyltransferase involved in cell wall biosynthesis